MFGRKEAWAASASLSLLPPFLQTFCWEAASFSPSASQAAASAKAEAAPSDENAAGQVESQATFLIYIIIVAKNIMQ